MSTELCLTQYLFEKVSILVHLFILSYKSFLSVISVKKALSEYCENYRDISLTPLPRQLAKYLCSSRLGYDAGSSQCVHALCHVSWTIVRRPGAEVVTTLHNTRSCCKLGDSTALVRAQDGADKYDQQLSYSQVPTVAVDGTW